MINSKIKLLKIALAAHLLVILTHGSSIIADDEICVMQKRWAQQEDSDSFRYYKLANCLLRNDAINESIVVLKEALKSGFPDKESVTDNQKWKSNMTDQKWTDVLAILDANNEKYLMSINQDLLTLFYQDQEERKVDKVDWKQLKARDEMRRTKVKHLIDMNKLNHPDDYYYAAMIFQHGGAPENYKLAFELSNMAVDMDPTHSRAKWLSCAAEDRYLHSLRKPQIWGTQLLKFGEEPFTFGDFDQNAKTDDERDKMGVPRLDELKARLEQLNNQ